MLALLVAEKTMETGDWLLTHSLYWIEIDLADFLNTKHSYKENSTNTQKYANNATKL